MREGTGSSVPPGTPLRLLCIDDREEDTELEQLSLSRAGYRIAATRVASEEQLAAALDRGEWDVALLDYTLPGWDCRAALQQLLAARPGIPVISVAGTIGEEAAVEVLKLGAADYVAKDHLERLPFVVGRALEAAQDHRARLSAESALRASETRYRRMVETAAEGILVSDEDFTIVFCNERMSSLLGYGCGALLGRHVSELFVAEDGEVCAAQEARRRAGESTQYQSRLLKADGSELWVNVSASPILDDAGVFAGSLAMVADMSMQRAAEGRLRQALTGTVAAMGALVETRDPYTAGHERRTAELVVAMAREMGLSQDAIETLDLTARMHDIGQIAVPAEILTRPGRLSQNEFTLVKAHPQVAHDILSLHRLRAARRGDHPAAPRAAGRVRLPERSGRRRHAAGGAYPRRGGRRGGDVLSPALQAGTRRGSRSGRDRRRIRAPLRRRRRQGLRAGVRRGVHLPELEAISRAGHYGSFTWAEPAPCRRDYRGARQSSGKGECHARGTVARARPYRSGRRRLRGPRPQPLRDSSAAAASHPGGGSLGDATVEQVNR